MDGVLETILYGPGLIIPGHWDSPCHAQEDYGFGCGDRQDKMK